VKGRGEGDERQRREGTIVYYRRAKREEMEQKGVKKENNLPTPTDSDTLTMQLRLLTLN